MTSNKHDTTRRRRSRLISTAPGLTLLFTTACGGFDWEPLFHEEIDPEETRSVEIASLAEALTFARVQDGDERRVIAVTRYENGRIDGVDLTSAVNAPVTDPVDHSIDEYIHDARAAGIYLHAGDVVTIHVEKLGVVHNEVVE